MFSNVFGFPAIRILGFYKDPSCASLIWMDHWDTVAVLGQGTHWAVHSCKPFVPNSLAHRLMACINREEGGEGGKDLSSASPTMLPTAKGSNYSWSWISRGYGATVARLTPDQKAGSSNLSALIFLGLEGAA